MNRSQQRGIALVVTLIMLAVVTITAVAFLAVTRQDRASVGAAGEQLDARYAAETALQRAQAEVASRIIGSTNRQDFDLITSTNWVNPNLNVAALNLLANGGLSYNDLNVFTNATTYYRADGVPVFNLANAADVQLYRASLMNLYYDPRPPVFVPVSRSPLVQPEFRFYLDLNRNGRYDTNGVQIAYDQLRRPVVENGLVVTNDLVGDPHWIGVLEHPEFPHSGTNRFIMRYAYVALPAGKSLDLNFAHNEVKFRPPINPTTSGFLRNQGVGSWEINLAGYLADLNTNIWHPLGNVATAYRYQPGLGVPSTGLAFGDADRLFRARRGAVATLTAAAFFGGTPPFGFDAYDTLGNGPIPETLAEFLRPQDLFLAGGNEDGAGLPWTGNDNFRQWHDLTRLVDGSLDDATGLGRFSERMSGRIDFNNLPLQSTYDQNTFYRMLGSLGTDTGDGRFEAGTNHAGLFYRRAKLNLNYAPLTDPSLDLATSADVSTFRDWAPLEWYTNAVHRLLLTEFTNGLPDPSLLASPRTFHLGHGIPVHGTNVIRGITNIYRWDAKVHRLAQVAANLYDASHYRSAARGGAPEDAPSVFRPILYRQVTNNSTLVRLAGFAEVVNAVPMTRPWLDLENPVDVARLPVLTDSAAILAAGSDFNVYGIPWVVGAKKGLPNFQEGFWQSRVQLTRRLRVLKTQPAVALVSTNFRPWEDPRFSTEVQYRFDVDTTMGMEAWNSYFTRSNRTAVTLIATNYFDFSIRDENDPVNAVPRVFNRGFRRASATIPAGQWSPRTYLTPLNTAIVTNFVYDHIRRAIYPGNNTSAGYVPANAPAPRLTLAFTNRLVYVMIDQASGRILDMVNLKSVMYETNLLRLFAQPGGRASAGLSMSRFWDTNQYAGNTLVTRGIGMQLDGSIGSDPLGNAVDIPTALWRDAPGQRPANSQVEFEKDGMYYFLFRQPRRPGMQLTPQLISQFSGLVAQAGYTPSPSILLTDRRQANDPLVHYTTEDLAPGQTVFTVPEGYLEVPFPDGSRLRPPAGSEERYFTNHLGNPNKVVVAHSPWGKNPVLGTAADVSPNNPLSTAYDVAYKDPLVSVPDDWNFPTNKFPNLGWIGRVHRGTPWQTIYLKGRRPEVGSQRLLDRYLGQKSWTAWSGHPLTRPENDWGILDLFTTALNDNGAKGLLGVNQTNIAAWSGVLSGVPVMSNRLSASGIIPERRFIEPASPQMRHIVAGIQAARTNFPGGFFPSLGHVLSAGELSVGSHTNNGVVLEQFSPFLAPFNSWSLPASVNDEVMEAIPQQVLSLLRTDEPRMVIYAFGQSLKPAPNSLVTRPGVFFGLCTNYTVVGEFATRSVVRFDGAPRPGQLRPVVEDHRILTPDN